MSANDEMGKKWKKTVKVLLHSQSTLKTSAKSL
jgi:hypothetical protein